MAYSRILFARQKIGKIKIRSILYVLKMRSAVKYKESIFSNLCVDFSACMGHGYTQYSRHLAAIEQVEYFAEIQPKENSFYYKFALLNIICISYTCMYSTQYLQDLLKA
jgi:hypothetical protein